MDHAPASNSSPRVIAVIGARLNSSRLPGKQLLDLAGKPLIARIFERLDRVPNITEAVLATTADTYNHPLVEWAKQAGRSCFAYQGDVDDLVGRVDQVTRDHRADFLVYICGDCPLIDPGFIERALTALIQHPEAATIHLPPIDGRRIIHEGIDIYPRQIWDQTVAASRSEREREHVGLARHKQTQPQTVTLEEDPIYFAVDHRLSVDTPSDYRFMSEVYQRWYATNEAESIVALSWLIEMLQTDADLASINATVHQKSASETGSKILIFTTAGAGTGLGHLSRSITTAHALQDTLGSGVHLLIAGSEVSFRGLELLPHSYTTAWHLDLRQIAATLRPKAILFDLPKTFLHDRDRAILGDLATNGIDLINIDFSLPWPELPLFHWVPCHYLAEKYAEQRHTHFGWDAYLLPKIESLAPWQGGKNVLIMTGGDDIHHLGSTLPPLLLEKLPADLQFTWIRGPFSKPPVLPPALASRTRLLFQPRHVAELMAQSHYAVISYGLSFFEALQRGLPTVTYTHGQDPLEMAALEASDVAALAPDPETIVEKLHNLLHDPDRCRNLSNKTRQLIDGLGPQRLAKTLQKKWEIAQP